jgi:alginate O-acetyltransferase complex protein AlgI
VIFNSFSFLFIFLPAILLLFFMPGMVRFRPWIIIGGSLFFYGLSGIEHAAVLALDIVWVYALTRNTNVKGNNGLLYAAIVPPIFALIYYKYSTFLIGSFVDLETAEANRFDLFLDVILPAGISFFTFQIVSFAIDRYRGEIKDMPPFRHFAFYVSFFPQLVAGPILRYRDVADSLRGLGVFRLTASDVARAIGYIVIGLSAKVLIADTLSHYIDVYQEGPGNLSQISTLYVVLAYSFQIYFDFYGYSLVAIGLGTLFGFRFPDNFKRPYEALNPREFWRRWHVTLSFWIRDYLYIPLGGNRRYVANIIFVMAICGLWHGAGWTFVVWGLYHAALVCAYHFSSRYWDVIPKIFQRALTFSLVSIGWVLFLFDFSAAQAFLGSVIGGVEVLYPDPTLEQWATVLIAVLVCFGLRFERIAENYANGAIREVIRNGSLAILFLFILIFLDRSQTFIYFRF